MFEFKEISCKYISFRKIIHSDVVDIKNIRKKGETEGFLSKTPDNIDVFSQWIDNESLNPTTLYLAILDKKKNFIGTVRFINIEKNLFEWGSWVLKENLGPIISLNSIYVVYKMAIDLFNYESCEFKVKSHNKSVIKLHLKTGATIIGVKGDLTYFRIENQIIKSFLKKYESRFGDLEFVYN